MIHCALCTLCLLYLTLSGIELCPGPSGGTDSVCRRHLLRVDCLLVPPQAAADKYISMNCIILGQRDFDFN